MVANDLVTGAPETIGAMKEARKAWQTYKQFIGEGDVTVSLAGKPLRLTKKGDPSTKILAKLVDEQQATPEQVVNAFAGLAKLDGTAKTRNLILRMREHFGPDSQPMKLIRDAVIYRTFVRPAKGQSNISRTAIVKAYNENLRGANSVLRAVFNPDELKVLDNFVQDVAPTLPAELPLNPSGTSYSLLGAFADRGLLGSAMKLIKETSIVDAVRGQFAAGKQTAPPRNFQSIPLLSATGVTATRKAQ